MDFNPHSHAGSDGDFEKSGKDKLISIHTPTQGVTFNRLGIYENAQEFQSTLPRREWPGSWLRTLWNIQFQSTLPRREWQKPIRLYEWVIQFQSTLPRREWLYAKRRGIKKALYFNPHSHAGSDLLEETRKEYREWFQSTLPRREWRGSGDHRETAEGISIHTPTQGVTPASPVLSGKYTISIHTPTQGVTRYLLLYF